MNRNFLLGVVAGSCLMGLIWTAYESYNAIRLSNRKLVHLVHPVLGKRLTLLTLGGISHDVTYLIGGEYQSLEIPRKEQSSELGDEVGVAFTDSSWVIYYLGEIGHNTLGNVNGLRFVHLNPKAYNDLMRSSPKNFLYRGAF
jgi:hypothetical protein